MEEDHGNSNSNSNGSITVDTTKWDRSVWLMKCPLVVSKSWQSQSAASSSSSDSPQVAKVIVSVDPLRSDDSSALQFTMEMGGNDSGHMPKSYSLNMFQDFVPMCVLSETGQEIIGKSRNKNKGLDHNVRSDFQVSCPVTRFNNLVAEPVTMDESTVEARLQSQLLEAQTQTEAKVAAFGSKNGCQILATIATN
ncbi:hypothetical protein BC332_18676 [Capsicum chinense]|nr:hypothetical protein BC332_18676 [Capsicum chinense]